MLCKAMGANKLIGTDVVPERLELAKSLGLADLVITAGPDAAQQIRSATGGHGTEKTIECSANDSARLTAIQATRKWGDIAMVGEGNACIFTPSPDIIHGQNDGPSAPAAMHPATTADSAMRCFTPGRTDRTPASSAAAVALAFDRSCATSAGDLTHRISRMVACADAIVASGNALANDRRHSV